MNAGSSSIKFATYKFQEPLEKEFSGVVTNINDVPILKIKNEYHKIILEHTFSKKLQYSEIFNQLIAMILNLNSSIRAVGHRVVHGGADYYQPTLVTSQILQNLKKYIPFAPLHQPYNLEGIEIFKNTLPDVTQVACFDTAFHHTHPPIADYFALPRAYLESGIKRYGFHGLSYEFIMKKLHELEPDKINRRIIIAHLGNGASMSAVHMGKCMDSTMGFTALDGLVMGTRCGNLDPGVLLYLMQFKKMDFHEIEHLLYFDSGLLGVSGISSNMKTLLESNSPSAKEAIDLFVYRIRKELGALTAVLGGLDMLIFTGGIGENAPPIREAVCQNMEWLGLTLDKNLNNTNQLRINGLQSAVEIRVFPTDGEIIVAQHTSSIVINKN